MDSLRRFGFVLALQGLFLLVGAGSYWFVTGEMGAWVFGLGACGVLSFLGFGILDQERLKEGVQSRTFAYESGSALTVVMAAMIGVFGFVLADRHDKTWDWTSDGAYTLSQQSLQVIGDLKEDVQVKVFMQNESDEQRQARKLLRRYEEQNSHLQVEYIDPIQNPTKAREFEVQDDSLIVLVKGDAKRRIDASFDENNLTRNLLLLSSNQTHRVCWSMGHGEPDPDDEQRPEGIGGAVARLEQLNYEVTKTYAMTDGVDPACRVLVIAQPKVEWLPYEREQLAEYLAGGGRVLALLDVEYVPELTADFARYGILIGNDVLVDVNPENRMRGVQEPTMVVLTGDSVLAHPITRSLSASVVLKIARSVDIEGPKEGLKLTKLLQSGMAAWAETGDEMEPDANDRMGPVPLAVVLEVEDPEKIVVLDGERTPEATANAGMGRLIELLSYQLQVEPSTLTPETNLREKGLGDNDFAGIASALKFLYGVDVLAGRELRTLTTVGDLGQALAEGLKSKGTPAPPPPAPGEEVTPEVTPAAARKAGGKMVVIGDADFATNATAGYGNNLDLFLNAMAWLADEEKQIGERPEDGDKLEMTDAGGALLCLGSTILVPGLAFLGGIIALLRRRFL